MKEEPGDSVKLDMEFIHKSRKMFAYYNGEIIFAEQGDRRSHDKWFEEIGVPYESTPRGFVRGLLVCLYVGSNFHTVREWGPIVKALQKLLPVGTYDLGLGMRVSKPGTLWSPITLIRGGIVVSSRKLVRVKLEHSYVCYADVEVMIEEAKDAIVADMVERELRAMIKVEPAMDATEADIPEFLTEVLDHFKEEE